MLLHRMIAIAVSLGLLQCSTSTGESSIGTPCTPGSESDYRFAGFKIEGETIVTGAPECGGGVCLVNHFQGRVSCPLGQAPPQLCSGPTDPSCGFESKCVEAGTLAPGCDPSAPDKGSSACAGYGGVCNAATGSCMCSQTVDCPDGTLCDGATNQCTTYVCHKGDRGCQSPGADNLSNKDKACCIPGTDTPVAVPVCGQCSDDTNRDAERAVYCSCRCGVAEGQAEDPDFDFCECAAGFECTEVRPYLGLGDPKLAGKYCIRQGSEFRSESCGPVRGYFNSQQCEGLAASGN